MFEEERPLTYFLINILDFLTPNISGKYYKEKFWSIQTKRAQFNIKDGFDLI